VGSLRYWKRSFFHPKREGPSPEKDMVGGKAGGEGVVKCMLIEGGSTWKNANALQVNNTELRQKVGRRKQKSLSIPRP